MTQLSTINNQTMSSMEIAALTGKRHDHVLRDIRAALVNLYGGQEVEKGIPDKDMFESFCDRFGWGIASPELGNQRVSGITVSRDSRGFVAEIGLDFNHSMTVVSGYNVKLRKAIFDGWQELEAQAAKPVAVLPQTYIEALEQLLQAKKAEQLAIETKAQIGARREATAMNTASQAVKRANQLQIELDKSKQYASVKRMEMLYHGQKFDWRLLKSTAAQMEVSCIDVFDANYGTVKAYHADVWKEAYAVSIEAMEAA